MEAFVKNAADEEQVRSAKHKELSARQRELMDLRTVLFTVEGRRFYWRLLSSCGVFQTSFSHDPHRTSFNEGQRTVGLRLLAEVNEADPQIYILMMKESEDGRSSSKGDSAGRRAKRGAETDEF